MKELVVISGKGGTGKTSLVASFAALADSSLEGGAVLADCDVDAADLHLVVEPKIVSRGSFSGGSRARIVPGRCTTCGKCQELCRYDAVLLDSACGDHAEKTFRINPIACEGCGVCAWFCPAGAIEFGPVENGKWFVSETRLGPMVHAKLGVAEENSGKLVSLVRDKATQIARHQNRRLVIIDGSPGIGCPVIASITGSNLVLVVTEPTLSGVHDLQRVSGLTAHFNIETLVCINKWDINAELSAEIERLTAASGAEIVGKIRYDAAVTAAQIERRSLIEHSNDGAAADVREVWSRILERLKD